MTRVVDASARILILGGTAEAAALARSLDRRPTVHVITSLAGRTRRPAALPGEVRRGGFGGAAALAAYLGTAAIDLVVDATHPFAARIGRNAEQACRAAARPRLRLLRPPWPAEPGDRWLEVEDAIAAAARLPAIGRRAFITVGHKDLEPFLRLPAVWLLVRTIEPPPTAPPANVRWLTARPPFGQDDELELLRRHRIEVLVTKASGGTATYAKIEAARQLDLPVLMLRRPPPPPGPIVETVDAALAWLDTAISRI